MKKIAFLLLLMLPLAALAALADGYHEHREPMQRNMCAANGECECWRGDGPSFACSDKPKHHERDRRYDEHHREGDHENIWQRLGLSGPDGRDPPAAAHVGVHGAPEIDPAGAVGALTLLAGFLAIFRAASRKRTR